MRVSYSISIPAFLLLLFVWEGPLCAQSTLRIAGTVVDSGTGTPVPFVHVYTTTYSHGTVADHQGRFLVVLEKTDTLAFSSVGYEIQHFYVDPSEEKTFYEVRIRLIPKVYELDPVSVTAIPSIEQFKQDVLKMEIAREEKIELNIPKGYRLPPEGPADVNMNPSIGLMGPVSALYNVFSREAKEKKKLKNLREKIMDYREIDSKYNLAVVKQVTNLDDECAERFMEWCKFEDEFVLKSSAYDLAVTMLKCLDEFVRADTLR